MYWIISDLYNEYYKHIFLKAAEYTLTIIGPYCLLLLKWSFLTCKYVGDKTDDFKNLLHWWMVQGVL